MMSPIVDLRRVHPALTVPPYFVSALDVGEVRSALTSAGFKIHEADIRGRGTERQLLLSLGDALAFPEYFHPNWDAVYECVGDLSDSSDESVAVFVLGAEEILEHDVHAFVTSIHILLDIVTAVHNDDTRFQLEFIFVGDYGPRRIANAK